MSATAVRSRKTADLAPETSDLAVQSVAASAFVIPTDRPESDGTFAWDSTTLVLAEVATAEPAGLGYSYTSRAAATVIETMLAPAVVGLDPMGIPAASVAMRGAVRNVGATGIAASAIAAVDVALWDLKARILGLPLI